MHKDGPWEEGWNRSLAWGCLKAPSFLSLGDFGVEGYMNRIVLQLFIAEVHKLYSPTPNNNLYTDARLVLLYQYWTRLRPRLEWKVWLAIIRSSVLLQNFLTMEAGVSILLLSRLITLTGCILWSQPMRSAESLYRSNPNFESMVSFWIACRSRFSDVTSWLPEG